jgi:hypothetical protein
VGRRTGGDAVGAGPARVGAVRRLVVGAVLNLEA